MKKVLFVLMFAFVLSCAKNDGKSNVSFLQNFDLTKISIIVENAEDEKIVIKNEKDKKEIIKMLSVAEYDKELNDSGIMIKKVANNATLHISDGNQEVNILLWTESREIKFDGKWYNIRESGSNGLEVIKKVIN